MPVYEYTISINTNDERDTAPERLQAILEREVWLKFGDVATVERVVPVKWTPGAGLTVMT